jgi:hypothetical protein
VGEGERRDLLVGDGDAVAEGDVLAFGPEVIVGLDEGDAVTSG